MVDRCPPSVYEEETLRKQQVNTSSGESSKPMA
jgi:hypothetical protein